jgi:hypothetical protein
MVIKQHIAFIQTAGYAKGMILPFNLTGVHDSCLGQRSERYHNRYTADRIIYNLMPIEDFYGVRPSFRANPHTNDVIRTIQKIDFSSGHKIGIQYGRDSIFRRIEIALHSRKSLKGVPVKERLEVVSKPHLRSNGCVAPLTRDSHLILCNSVPHRPPVNVLAHPAVGGTALSRSA